MLITDLNTLYQNNNQRKQINFGSAVKSGLQGTDFFIKKMLDGNIGQTSSNAINYAGKAVLTPLMILAGSKFTNEKKESIKYSMLMAPLQGVLAFISATGISAVANSFIDKAVKNSDFFAKKAHLKELKGLSTIGMTILAIPFTSAIMSNLLPKIMKKIDKTSTVEMVNSSLYTRSIKPDFGSFTGVAMKKWSLE